MLWEKRKKRNGSVLVCHADYYENPRTQDSQEESDLTPDIYSSPIECFPFGTEVVFNSTPPPPHPPINNVLVFDSLNNNVFFFLQPNLLSNLMAMDIGNHPIGEVVLENA